MIRVVFTCAAALLVLSAAATWLEKGRGDEGAPRATAADPRAALERAAAQLPAFASAFASGQGAASVDPPAPKLARQAPAPVRAEAGAGSPAAPRPAAPPTGIEEVVVVDRRAAPFEEGPADAAPSAQDERGAAPPGAEESAAAAAEVAQPSPVDAEQAGQLVRRLLAVYDGLRAE